VSSRRLVRGSVLAIGGLVGLGVVQLVRALPLVAEGPQRPSGEKKDKDEKKDKKNAFGETALATLRLVDGPAALGIDNARLAGGRALHLPAQATDTAGM